MGMTASATVLALQRTAFCTNWNQSDMAGGALFPCHSQHAVDRFLTCLHTGRMMRCLRCPIAYHFGDACVAAGSVSVSSHILICSNHSKRSSQSAAINVGFCFVCARGECQPILFPCSDIICIFLHLTVSLHW